MSENTGYSTDQENFWAGEFGDQYVDRNVGAKLVAGNTALFAEILHQTRPVRSVIEFGANIGLNLIAIRHMLPEAELAAVEINSKAVTALKQLDRISVYAQSILEFTPERTWEFVFTKGVLIHIKPESLPQVYDRLHQASSRYICLAEYYNPTPVSIPYRGHSNRLFKRDFAGELLDRFEDLRLAAYGFVYHGDNNYPLDDITWFLLEKTSG